MNFVIPPHILATSLNQRRKQPQNPGSDACFDTKRSKTKDPAVCHKEIGREHCPRNARSCKKKKKKEYINKSSFEEGC